MHPVYFEGSKEIKKPSDMTDEQCSSIWATRGIDEDGYPYYLTAWKPSFEDLKALNNGQPVYVKTVSTGLPPMALFTIDNNPDKQD